MHTFDVLIEICYGPIWSTIVFFVETHDLIVRLETKYKITVCLYHLISIVIHCNHDFIANVIINLFNYFGKLCYL